MFRQTTTIILSMVFMMSICAFPPSSFAEAKEPTCEEKARDKPEAEQEEALKECDEQKQAVDDGAKAARATESDMKSPSNPSPGPGGGGIDGLLGPLLGMAGGMLGAKMMMGSAEDKMRAEAEKAKEEMRAEFEGKLKEAEEKQKAEFERLKEEFRAEIDEEMGGNEPAPTIGAATGGLGAQIEAAFRSGNLSQVQSMIDDPEIRSRLPASYIVEIERRIASGGGGIGGAADVVQAATQVAGQVADQAGNIASRAGIDDGTVAAISDGLDDTGNSIFSKSARVKDMVEYGMVDQTRQAILSMILEGQLNAAADQINRLEQSSDSQMVALSYELKSALDSQLEQMGLPGGNLGLGLLTN